VLPVYIEKILRAADAPSAERRTHGSDAAKLYAGSEERI
jgi:hypothetical protein